MTIRCQSTAVDTPVDASTRRSVEIVDRTKRGKYLSVEPLERAPPRFDRILRNPKAVLRARLIEVYGDDMNRCRYEEDHRERDVDRMPEREKLLEEAKLRSSSDALEMQIDGVVCRRNVR